ncbi:type I restriction enzyme S subunit [Sphingorhabdus rigui]|uniref:Type I restriction enzyme S subunit n=1 Tax=Sphingorhabdus rigui TaxID=1282858 RepID=A0A840B1L0_9SPHN|nr:restriction endonuclease subunit S [Sphingorhabdus rigui]MBB3943811.1 type I restriction enzyme S subunit [Sphingorhabdus rigui]
MAAVKLTSAEVAGFQVTEIGMIPSDWKLQYVDDFCKVSTGGRNTQDRVADGEYPFFVRSQTIENIDRFSYDEEAILTAGDGVGTGKVFHYISGKYDAHQRVYRMFDFNNEVSGKYFFRYFSEKFYARIMQMTAKSSVDSVRRDMITRMPIALPVLRSEQEAIAEALSDADTLIESLAHLIAKKRAIKQGMAQALLTGNVRLLNSKNEWKLAKLGDYAEFFKGKGLPKSDIAPSGRFSCIHYGELFTTYGAIIKKVHSRTDRIDVALLSKRYDVLMPTSDVTPYGLAKASCLTQENVVIGGDTLVIRTDQTKINGTFLAMQIRYREEQILKLVTGSTVFHLYASDMRKFELPIPPISEQSAIVEALSAIDSDIDGLCSRLAKAQQIKIGMTQVLLTGTARLV